MDTASRTQRHAVLTSHGSRQRGRQVARAPQRWCLRRIIVNGSQDERDGQSAQSVRSPFEKYAACAIEVDSVVNLWSTRSRWSRESGEKSTHSQSISSRVPLSSAKDVRTPAPATDLMRAVTSPYRTDRVEVMVVPLLSSVKLSANAVSPVEDDAVRGPMSGRATAMLVWVRLHREVGRETGRTLLNEPVVILGVAIPLRRVEQYAIRAP